MNQISMTLYANNLSVQVILSLYVKVPYGSVCLGRNDSVAHLWEFVLKKMDKTYTKWYKFFRQQIFSSNVLQRPSRIAGDAGPDQWDETGSDGPPPGLHVHVESIDHCW